MRLYYFYIYNTYRNKYDIDPTFEFNAEGIGLIGEGEIIIGANGYIGAHSSIQSLKGCKVIIGNNCQISHFVNIYTSNLVADQRMPDNLEKRVRKMGDVVIGNNCWIGLGVFITEGVEIGENSVIGANSVVTKDIPPHSIAVGCPAKVVKFKSYLNDYEKLELVKQYFDSLGYELKEKFKNNVDMDFS